MPTNELSFPWIGLLLGLIAAAANIFGGWAVARGGWQPIILRSFVALAAGFMLGASFLEMFPESYKLLGPEAAWWMLGGYLLIHFFEHTLSGHFHFGEEVHKEEMRGHNRAQTVLFGLMIHAFVDGVSIVSGFLVSDWLGWVVFLAVFLHKMPEGFAVSSVMKASGASTKTALTAAALLGAATVAGALVMAPLSGQVAYTLPISAGVTLYVAASDLIPEVNHEPNIKMAMLVFVGVVMLLGLRWAFGF
ncbi:MAG: ZIP family magnesium transporter [Acidobacteria bacterium]|nr:ZIP family magnesium transporter [Acidobacteriota bacterium]